MLYEGRTPAEIVPALMLREAKPELRGMRLRDAGRCAREAAVGRASTRGAVSVVGESWSLDWWIGADDRWRVAASEPAVRQRTIEGTPVAGDRDAGPGW